MNKNDLENLDFKKMNGLLPVIVQDSKTDQVLVLGFMNEEALKLTLQRKRVIFYSRTRSCLWEKGKNSGNYLNIVDIFVDCDRDTLLIKVNINVPVCHTGAVSCFDW